MSRRFLTTLGALFVVALHGCYATVTSEEPGLGRELEQEPEIEVASHALYPLSTALWPQDREIQVCWENPSPSDAVQRGWVQDAVTRSWEAASNLRFTNWTACGPSTWGIRIQILDEARAPHVIGLGKELNGLSNGMVLNFTFTRWGGDCVFPSQTEGCIRKIAVHEFGHALGFSHEQNRPDTDPVLCDDPPQGRDGDTKFGPWDLASVMNYCNPIANNNGILSATDTAAVRALYGTRRVPNFGFDNGSWRSARHPRMVADVNDDGRDDVVGFGDNGVIVSLALPGGAFDTPRTFLGGFGYNNGWRIEKHVRTMADVDGDGRADVVGFGTTGMSVALSGGSRFYAPADYAEFGYDQGWRVEQHVRTTADVNGDGRADIVGFGQDGVWVSFALGGAALSTPQLLIADFGYNNGWRVEKHVRTLADVNGDGRDDVVGFGTYGVVVALSLGNGFSAPQQFTHEFGAYAGYLNDRHPRMLADVDGDGRADVVAIWDDGVRVALSGSVTFYPSTLVLQDMGYGAGWRMDKHPRFARDVNGDGRADLVGFGDAGVLVATALGGSAFSPLQFWATRYSNADKTQRGGSALPSSELVHGLGDFDADGAADVFLFRANGFHVTDLTTHIIP